MATDPPEDWASKKAHDLSALVGGGDHGLWWIDAAIREAIDECHRVVASALSTGKRPIEVLAAISKLGENRHGRTATQRRFLEDRAEEAAQWGAPGADPIQGAEIPR